MRCFHLDAGKCFCDTFRLASGKEFGSLSSDVAESFLRRILKRIENFWDTAMNDVDREMLTGYLLNALEEDETAHIERELLRRPELRSELADLQKKLAPLASALDTAEPPRNLARRTCDRIWARVDREEKFGRFIDFQEPKPQIISLSLPESSGPFIASKQPIEKNRNEALEEIVALSPRLPERRLPEHSAKSPSMTSFAAERPETDNTMDRRLVKRANSRPFRQERHVAPDSSGPKRRSSGRKRWADLLTSVGIGILIAIIAFPAINFAKNRVRHIVTQKKLKQINQSIPMLALSGEGEVPETERETGGVNLAYSGWQEFDPDRLSLLLGEKNEAPSASQTEIREDVFSSPLIALQPVSGNASILTERQGRDIVLGQAPDPLEETGIDPRHFSYQTLISNVNHVPHSFTNGSTVQTASGQNILFHNGRIFFRILPVFNSNP